MKKRRLLPAGMYKGDNLVSLTDIRYLPRWVVLVIDVLFLALAAFISRFVVEKMTLGAHPVFAEPAPVYGLIIAVGLLYMFVFRTYAGIIRHSTFIDLLKLFLASFSLTVTVGALAFLSYLVTGTQLLYMALPFLFLLFAGTLVFTFLFRLLVKEFFHLAREFRRSTLKKRILVVGIEEQSVAVARAVLDNPHLPYHIAGFVTENAGSSRARLLGKPILSRSWIERHTKEDLHLDGVLLVKETLARDALDRWVTLFLEKGLQVLKAPSVAKMRDLDTDPRLKKLQIEDLLNRRPITIENEEVEKRHRGKTILVTGGAGSIGSEIVRQVADLDPDMIVVLDQAETPLYDTELELRAAFPAVSFKFVLADITNRERLAPLFEKYRFAMVYHAAAYKHVPLIEENPHEGVLVNLLGTRNLAELASQHGVNRFVMISTDKAVKPTNVMGATKRSAELFVQALQQTPGNATKFITTRFGNVLGSNGSVIPHFKKQIQAGGPVTITHPDIVRYFMTIPEACELVLQAGTMGSGGEIFVFDMGDPVRIVDLATRMIRLSGLDPDLDIKIIYTGLRPGEKLYEELLSDDTTTLPTPHEKILVSRDPQLPFEVMCTYCTEMAAAASREQKLEVVRLLKKIVPEFKSNNSIYESLD